MSSILAGYSIKSRSTKSFDAYVPYRIFSQTKNLHDCLSYRKCFICSSFGIPFFPVPLKHKLVMALGSPIEVAKIDHPTEKQVCSPKTWTTTKASGATSFVTRLQVEELHDRYCQNLKDLFDRHKHKIGWDAKSLHFEDEDIEPLAELSKQR